MKAKVALLVLFLSTSLLLGQAAANSDWTPVEKALGRAGKLQDGVYKVSFPRSDLDVHIGNTKLQAGLALGSWAGFRSQGKNSVTDGDLVLLASEVSPVIDALQSGGLTVTGIHNHLIGEEPQVMYVHFFGQGDAGKLAATLHEALGKTKTPQGPAAPPKGSIAFDQKAIESTLGKAGTANGSVLAFNFARPHPITMMGAELPPGMGMATAINFQSSSKGVATTGDFVLREDEVQAVMAALRKGGIEVTALHNHLLDDQPRMMFMHFWGEGPAGDVARTLKSALDAARMK